MKQTGPNKSGWDDEEDDWGAKPGSIKPGAFPPTPPPRGASIVTWMYIVVAVLVTAQIAYYFLSG
jgi:hypothetical protein